MSQSVKPHLAHREEAVLELLAEGHDNKEIARRLGLGESTVKTYLRRIYAKLGVHSRQAAVAKHRTRD